MLGAPFSPRAKAGVSKYGAAGGCDSMFKNLMISERAKKSLAEVGKYGLAKSTWSNYRTAETMLWRYKKESGDRVELPLSEDMVLGFIEWLISARKVKHATINNYLSGLRQLHLEKGMPAPEIRSGLVKFVLTAKKNKDNVEQRSSAAKGRLPVTLNIMKLLKAKLKSWGQPAQKKLLVWAVCCLAFNGAFRIHELLSKEEGQFDPLFCLLTEDVSICRFEDEGCSAIQIKLKCPKEDKKGKDFIVDVYESGGKLCPVRALKKWLETRPPQEKGMPMFRLQSGEAFTGREFNRILKELLSPHLDYARGSISSHSFRAGIVTLLGQAGYSDEDIKAIGRWSSRAFEAYLKLPRTKRAEMARRVGRLT